VRHRPQGGVVDDPAAVPGDRLPGPQLAGEAQPFEHAPDAFLEGDAAGHEFGADIGHVAGDADPEDETPFADLVQGRDAVRQDDRVAQRGQQDRGAEFGAPRTRGDRGQEGQRLVPGARQDRIADPDRIVAKILGPLGQRQQGRHFGAAFHDLFAGRQQVSDARRHGRLLWW